MIQQSIMMEVDDIISNDYIVSLMDKVKNIEKEIAELGQILETNSVGMSGTLVDSEGFPRQDIDVYQVRHARHRIICLQNDHKMVMKEIEKGLHEIHLRANEIDLGFSPISSPVRHKSPIARLGEVSSGSPAEDAGLQMNDLIIEFGTVNESNFSSLQDIAAVLNHSTGRKITLVVERSDQVIRVQLTPKRWTGKGLLGCVVLPFESIDR